MNGLLQLFNRLGLARVAAMGVVAALMLGFFAFLIMRASSPQLAPLYTGLSFEDSAAIVEELQKQNIPNEIRGDGDTILVPRDQITTLRMSLASDGLPARGQVGYEIFDQQNSLGATSFVQNINNVRALEGELARTIASLARIKSTRVHLVLPERALFSRDKKEPTASIVVSVRGELSAGEIRAIQHLVASAIEGLTPNRVSIVDDTGNLLAAGVGDDEAGILAGEAEERTVGVESRLRARIEELLANVIGDGRARVQVSAELDMTRQTRTAETFNPDGQVVRSTQTRDLQNASTAPGAEGQTSVSTQLPGAQTTGNATTGTAETGSTTEETTNYEISKTSETQMTDPGGIKRLSVAVVVDGIYTTDSAGNSAYAPRDQAQLDQIKSLVQSAIGFDQTRGDQITVANMQFAQGPTPVALGTPGPGLFDFTRDDLIGGAQMIVTLIIALALVLFVMRPLLRKVLTPETAPLALPVSAEIGMQGAPSMAMAMPQSQQMELQEEAPSASPSRAPAWMNNAKAVGETQAQTLKTVGALVDENPKQAAVIVRDWLSSAA